MHQRTANPIRHEIGAQITDVGIAVHGWAASVHLDEPRRGGVDLFHPFGQGVVDVEQKDLFYLRLRAKRRRVQTLGQFSTFQRWLPAGVLVHSI